MRIGDFLTDVGRPVSYHASLAPVVGGVKAAILLCQLSYWRGKEMDEDGWMFKTREELESETGLSRYEQESARAALRDRGVLEEARRGMPAKLYYRLNLDKLEVLWETARSGRAPRNVTTMVGEKPPPQRGKTRHHNGGKTTITSIGTENTSETTSEITTTTPFGRGSSPARARDDNHGGGNLLAAVWTRETGATLNPAQWRKLTEYERLAAEKGLPELVAATIRECAEKGKPWEWFTTVIQGRLDGTAKPIYSAAAGSAARPSPNGHTTLKQQAEERQRQRAAEEDTYDPSKPEDEARAICHDEFMNPDSRRMMKLPPWTCECGQHDARGRRLQAVTR